MAPSSARRGGRGGGRARRNPLPPRGPGPSNSQPRLPPPSESPTRVVHDPTGRRTSSPFYRLRPDLTLKIHEGHTLQRCKGYVERFCTGEIRILDGDIARYFLRSVIRQSGEPYATETCISTLGNSVHGIFMIVEALRHNIKDVPFLNDYVGQLFLFLTHLTGNENHELDVGSFDDHIRRIMTRIVADNYMMFRYLTKAAKAGKLNSDAMEGFARFLVGYLEFSPQVPGYIQSIITDATFLERLLTAEDEGVQYIGQLFKYWSECDSHLKLDDPGNYQPGGRHDNDFKDYRRIRIIPSPEELSCTTPSFLPKAAAPFKHKGDPRVGAHLDAQFRLLREEMVNEVRADYHNCIDGKIIGPKPNHSSERPKLVLENLQWHNWDFECGPKTRKFGIRLLLPNGFEPYVKFGGKNYFDLLCTDQSFPYKNNQLACLVVGDEVVAFPKMVRDFECLRENPPAIVLMFEGKEDIRCAMKKLCQAVTDRNNGDPEIKLVCIDTPVFAHEPVLKRLQAMRAIPLADELLHFEQGDQIEKTSFSPDSIIDYITPERPLRDLVKAGLASITMDKAQCTAIKRALQNKVSLIQGPPGTGKTMVGNVIAKLLYLYTNESMVVITQQNHICDEFLENLLEMEVKPEHVVRLGSQFSDATRSVSVNELTDESHLYNSAKEAIKSIEYHIDAAWSMVEESMQELFFETMTWKDIREIAIRYNEQDTQNPEDRFGYISAFTVPDAWTKIVLEADPRSPVLADEELFQLWAEDAGCPPGMANYMTEDGRELWDMPPKDRKILLGWFKDATMTDQIEGLVNATTIYNQQIDELNRWKETRFRSLFKEKRIIAATTNGAAKYLSAIADAAPKILIVEEAAQILESHVLAALHGKIEQVIMIGDQKQLRPRCETWEFQVDSERGYNFDISLFERLVNAGFPCDVLETQHRARPELANIIRSLTYPELKDHKSVHQLARVRGLQRNIIWMEHQYAESGAHQVMSRKSTLCKNSSKVNEFEADMVVSIVRYLGAQGYGNDHIVILSPYLAQVGLITKKMKQRGQFDVLLSQGDYHELVRAGFMQARDLKGVDKYIEVSTVDQFQGSDRDIVIVSMVRCNPEQKASFIRAPERANVLLSRARKGLIILGDLYSVTDSGMRNGHSVWRDVFLHFKKNGYISPGIPIVCENHPNEKYICKTPEELDRQTPEGRCRRTCEVPLSCGKHTCSFYCHGEPDHSRMECKVMEKKTCSNGHEWEDICWTTKPKPCEKCSKIDAHFKAMEDEEEADRTKEYETKLAAETNKLKQAEEAKKKLEFEREEKLNYVREQRLIAEGKLQPKPKRVPYIRPFGQTAERKIAEEQAARASKEQEELDRRIRESQSSPPKSSPVQLGLRPLRVADLHERYNGKGSGPDAPTSEVEQRDQNRNSSAAQVEPKSQENPQQPEIPDRFRVPGLPVSNNPITLISRGVLDEGSDSEIPFEVNVQAPTPRKHKRPNIRMDDDFSFEETTDPVSSEPIIPSSPPMKITQLPAVVEEAEQQPTSTMPVKEAQLVVEEVSEMEIQETQYSVADESVIVEEPATFIEEATQIEGTTTIIIDDTADVSGSMDEAPENNEILASPSTLTDRADSPKSVQSPESVKENIMPLETASVSKSQTASAVPTLKTDKMDKPLESSEQTQPVSSAPFEGPFPSANRDEWQRHKELTKDSNVALDQIMDMIGMEHVKGQVLAIKAKVDTVHRQGINLRGERFHVALLGNPGTGKTTFAGLYAKFLRSEGVLEGLSYVETTGARMAHDGITGLQAIFDQLLDAKGGTLFIDEAYQLVTSGAFEGRQVLDFLLSEMEKHLGKIIVIISGYNKEMEKFFEHNPGLHSRIPYRVQFEDFTNDELLYILQTTIKGKFGNRMKIEDGYSGLYMRIVAKRLGRMRGMPGCGNARGVQNAVAKILERHAARVTKERKQGLVADDFLLTKEDVIGPAPSKAAMESEAWKELHRLIGLNAVKESVMVLLKRMERNYQRELAEEKPIDVSLNRVFLGSPGTGKTSVAKIYGKILAQLGLLSGGEVVMKTPSDFLGRALGESEANTKAILNASRGKVLIIDEAYMFNPKLNGADDPYKSAVIDTIVSEVQNVPGDDQCVLLLGYKEDLEKMFNAVNPGLSRRFPLSDGFVFEDFTDVELSKILDLKLRLAEISASPESREVAIRKISQRRQKTNFGNAGEVENLLSVAKERMLKRQIDGGDSAAELLPTDFDPDHDRGTRADSGLTDLFKDLIGVENVIRRFDDYQTTSMVMRGRGIDPKEHIPLLFIFKGPPGTGKTTTARKMGQIFYNMGFLASNEVVECSASDLVAEYVGQTAHRTRKKLEQGLGKVLFIDEAYRLQENQYGIEASNELVDAVTKPQYMGKLVIILAGYDEGMDKLLAVNVGLASRFSEVIEFPDVNYSTATEIVKTEVKKAKVEIPSLEHDDSDHYAEISGLLKEISESKGWGHARDAQNLAKGMVNKAYRGVKRVNDPVVVTHEIAVGVLVDMLKQRKGRTFIMPVLKPASAFPPPRVQYQEPVEAPKVSINIEIEKATQVEEIVEVQQTVPAEPIISIVTKSDPVVEEVAICEPEVETATKKKRRKSKRNGRITVKTDDEHPSVSEDPEGREPGTTDENWEILTQSLELEEERITTQKKLQSELRQKLATAKREHEDAAANHVAIKIKNMGRRAPIFKQRIEAAKLQEQKANEAVTEIEKEIEETIQHEKVREAREKINMTKLDRMGLCPKKYHWIKVKDGYRCAGGEHHITNEDLDAYLL
ncbi:hypothetical protein TWF281_002435 [Arthrobotrys megalospora]